MAAHARVALILLLGVLSVGCDLLTPPAVVVRQGFEVGWEGWQKGSDVPQDPQTNRPVAWAIELSTKQFKEGYGSARFFLDGRQDDGTIWLAKLLTVPKGRPLVVTPSFYLWSPEQSDNVRAYVVAYAGALMPVEEAEFTYREPADKTKGWRRYQFTMPVSSTEGELWVALGISVAWETLLEYFVDEIRVEVR
ncbi:MAG: hypothetical protein ACK4HB_03295 [Candidatus Bipolaricaulia bacterium]